jgi:tetratricopeptide (TPR) repeat protein
MKFVIMILLCLSYSYDSVHVFIKGDSQFDNLYRKMCNVLTDSKVVVPIFSNRGIIYYYCNENLKADLESSLTECLSNDSAFLFIAAGSSTEILNSVFDNIGLGNQVTCSSNFSLVEKNRLKHKYKNNIPAGLSNPVEITQDVRGSFGDDIDDSTLGTDTHTVDSDEKSKLINRSTEISGQFNNFLTDKKRLITYYKKGVDFCDRQEYQSAISTFESGIDVNPKDPTLYYGKAVALDGLNRQEDASEFYRFALIFINDETKVNDSEERILYSNICAKAGDVYLREKKFTEASRSYILALNFDPEDNELNERKLLVERLKSLPNCFIDFDMKYVSGYFEVAEVLLSLKSDPDALLCYDNLIRVMDIKIKGLQPHKFLGMFSKTTSEIFIIKSTMANVHKRVAEVYTKNNNYEKALDCLNRALFVLPMDLEALERVTEILIELGDYVEATDNYMKVLDLIHKRKTSKSEISAMCVKLGRLLEDKGSDKAFELFARYNELKLPNADIYEVMGDIYLKLKNEKHARINYSKALYLDNYMNYDLLVKYAGLKAKAGEYEQAVHYYHKALNIRKEASIYIKLGDIYKKSAPDDPTVANEYYITAARLSPDDPQACMMVGDIYSSAEDFGQAVFWYDEASKRDNNNFQLAVKVAQLYHNNQQNDKALNAYKRALKIKPNSPEVYEWIKGLNVLDNKEINNYTDIGLLLQKSKTPEEGNIEKGAEFGIRKQEGTNAKLRYKNNRI